MKKVPMAIKKDDVKGGWLFDFEFVNHISAITSSMAWPVGMEETESVLVALMQEGYIDTAPDAAGEGE